MDIRKIKTLIEMLEESNLNEIEDGQPVEFGQTIIVIQ